MGEYADDEIDRWIGDCNWGSRRRYYSPPPKPSNRQVFARFAEPSQPIHGLYKTGVRVVHKASGSAGVVLATRHGQICWRPDSRLKPGGIWVDESAFRFEL